MITCWGELLSPSEGSLGRRGGRGGGGPGLGSGAGGGGMDVTEAVVTGGGHGDGEEEPIRPPPAACCDVTVGDVAGEVEAEFSPNVVAIPDAILLAAD